MKKRCSTLFISTAIASMLMACTNQPAGQKATAAQNYPADTLCYFSAQNSGTFKDDPRFIDFKKELCKAAELSAEQAAELDAFIDAVQSISLGVGELSLSPVTVEAGGMLTGTFSPEQIESLKTLYTEGMQLTETEPIGDVKVYSRVFTQPATENSPAKSCSLFATLPENGTLAFAADRSYLEFMLNHAAASTGSLADDPAFNEMLATLDTQSADTLSFVRTQGYMETVFKLVSQVLNQAPQTSKLPFSIDTVLDTLKTNMGMQDWGNAISAWDLTRKTGVSKMKIKTNNPLYEQLIYKEKMSLPHVPADANQAVIFNLNDAGKGFRDFVGMINETAKLFVPPAMGEPVALAEKSAGFKFDDLAAHLSGPVAFWQSANLDAPQSQKICIRIGVKDSEAFKAFFNSIPALAQLNPVEIDGIYSLAGALSWAFKDNAFYLSSDANYLKASLDTQTAGLFDSADFKELIQQADPDYTMLQYANYSNITEETFGQLNTPANADLLKAYLNMFKGMSTLQTSTAKDGMLTSKTFSKY